MHGTPTEVDDLLELGPRNFPRIAVAQPVVRLFDLETVGDMLQEHAVFITDAVADHWQLQCGAAVHEAGRESAEAAVAQTRIRLLINQVFEHNRERVHCFAGLVLDIKIQQMVTQRAPDQEFERHIIGPAGTGLLVAFPCLAPLRHDAVTHRQRQSLVQIKRHAVEKVT